MTTPWKDLVDAETEEEAAKILHYMYTKKKSLAKVAAKCLVSLQTLRNLFKKYDLDLYPWGGWNKVNIVVTKEKWKNHTFKELAEEFGCSIARIQKATKKYGKKRDIRKKLNQTKRSPRHSV